MSNEYQKYRIPPDFDLAQLHVQSCKLFEHLADEEKANSNNKCGCCQRIIGTRLVPMCGYVSSLRRIGEEVPLFFHFITLMIMLCLVIMFAKVGEYLFFCDRCTIQNYEVKELWGLNFTILLGFSNSDNLLMMIQIIAYSLLILTIKIVLKTRKYKYRAYNTAIQKRSVELINLPKDCSVKDIEGLFRSFHVQEVNFTFRVREYHKCMTKIARIKKNLRYLQSRIMHDGQDQKISRLQAKLQRNTKFLVKVLKELKSKKKRLSIAFVVFSTPEQRNRALKQHRYGFISKAFCKLCVCLSKNVIRGQHVTVESAPAPDDIRWQNLENPYLRTKAIRFSSFLVCTTILLFGIVSEVIVFNNNTSMGSNDSTGQVFSSLVIFVINFLIINFLQFTTNKIEAHQSNTHIKLSLIRKITFFMFFNVSISPFLIMIYNRAINETEVPYLLNTISLTIMVVSVGNFFKPFLTLFSIHRFTKWVKCLRERSKGAKSELNQLQANIMFEPLQFPIEVYYSLLHASLMMSFFYLGCFQFLIVLQLFSLLMLYFIAKWMLLRVCKQPRGLSLKLNNLAQSLMRFYVPLYWLGRNLMLAIRLPDAQFGELTIFRVLELVVYKDTYQIVSTSMVGLMLVCEVLVARIAQRITPRTRSRLSDCFDQMIGNNRSYSQANLFFNIHEENLVVDGVEVARRQQKGESMGQLVRGLI